jgi:hypothetical protein
MNAHVLHFPDPNAIPPIPAIKVYATGGTYVITTVTGGKTYGADVIVSAKGLVCRVGDPALEASTPPASASDADIDPTGTFYHWSYSSSGAAKNIPGAAQGSNNVLVTWAQFGSTTNPWVLVQATCPFIGGM